MFKAVKQYHSTLPLPPKQLRMVLDEVSVVRLPDVPLPAGYVIWAHRFGDAASWTDVLQKGEFGKWDEERVLEYLEDAERREGSRLVELNGRIVAVTFASRIGNQPRKPSVGGGNSSDVGGPSALSVGIVIVVSGLHLDCVGGPRRDSRWSRRFRPTLPAKCRATS